jgi:gamma-butyrobetaine dioxygenase
MSGLDVIRFFALADDDTTEESVTPLEHARQCAALARAAGAPDDVVLAALLHDIAHVATREPEQAQHHHGRVGAALLRPFVSDRVAWLVEHHVVAKRYLCAVEPDYAMHLSPASRRSLTVQGPGLADAEREALERHPWFADAVRIRRWDDLAKDPAASSSPLIAYRPLLEQALGPQTWVDVEGITRI